MKITKTIIATTILFALVALALACSGGDSTSGGAKPLSTKKVNDNLNVTLSGADGKLKNGEQTIILEFTDGAGNPVEIKAATLNFNMAAMGSMAEMNDSANLKTTETPGRFKEQ